MRTLLLLGFALSLDSFRVSLGLGALKLRTMRQAQVVLCFGLCEALAPLVGLLIGKSIIEHAGAWAEHWARYCYAPTERMSSTLRGDVPGRKRAKKAAGLCWACRSPLVWTTWSPELVWG